MIKRPIFIVADGFMWLCVKVTHKVIQGYTTLSPFTPLLKLDRNYSRLQDVTCEESQAILWDSDMTNEIKQEGLVVVAINNGPLTSVLRSNF